uniref:Uncharacterized protein n=1 Tax=Podoviridae sp. ctz6O13 TaxID=2827757 RepID=A0A8S5TKM0_9CAUD|nr:MAG TPA: hypothetical protein [Podoviridae sp. ctz6O13]
MGFIDQYLPRPPSHMNVRTSRIKWTHIPQQS